MFVGIIQFPKIKQGREADFVEWFGWSSSEFAKLDGLVARRLLKSATDGSYVGIIEFRDKEAYKRIHQSPIHGAAFARLAEMLDGAPKKSFYSLESG